MKLILKGILVIFIYTGLAMSCEKDDDNISQQNSSVSEIKDVAESGNWKITYFFDSDQNETDHFVGYVFTFNENGSLRAVNGSTTITGTWSVTDSNSSDDDGGSSDVDFNIFFATPSDFEDLSDDWEIIFINNSVIELTDVSGGNGGTDFLTFEKI